MMSDDGRVIFFRTVDEGTNRVSKELAMIHYLRAGYTGVTHSLKLIQLCTYVYFYMLYFNKKSRNFKKVAEFSTKCKGDF